MERRLIIGFVGLGVIGSSVAKNLLKAGHEVVGFDLVSERSSELAAAGGRAAASPRLAAEKADYVMTALPEPKDLEQAVAVKTESQAPKRRPGCLSISAPSTPTPRCALRSAFGRRRSECLSAR